MTKGFFYIVLFFVVVLMAESCKNNDEVFPTVLPTALNIVNASPDTLNFYLNGTRQNNTSSIFPVGQSYYLTIPAGKENLQFKNAGSFNILFSFPATLIDSTNYSLYITGSTASGAFIASDFLDTTNTQNGINFKLRFVNASPDAGPLNVTVDSLPYNNVAFKTITAFNVIGEGPKQVEVFQGGSATPSIDTTITFTAGHLYTLYSKGLLNGKGTAVFDVGLATNF